MNEGTTPIDILLVRGNVNNHYMTNDMLRLRRLSNPVHSVDGALEALDYLNGRAEYARTDSAPRPGVMVIDLDDIDGDRLIVAIRNNPELFDIPVIVLRDGSNHAIDLRSDYGPTMWLSRPASLQQLTTAMREVGNLSFEVNMLRHDRWYETQMWIRNTAESARLTGSAEDIDLSEDLAFSWLA